MIVNTESFRISRGEEEKLKNYRLWLGPGTSVFTGDPDGRNPVSNGTIPEDSEVLVRTIFGWPRRKTENVPVQVVKTRSLATGDNYVVKGCGAETVLSVGGFILGQGDTLWVRASSFKKKAGDRDRREKIGTSQEKLSI